MRLNCRGKIHIQHNIKESCDSIRTLTIAYTKRTAYDLLIDIMSRKIAGKQIPLLFNGHFGKRRKTGQMDNISYSEGKRF